jgi:hypothetical protein
MAKRRFTTEEIIHTQPEADVSDWQGKSMGACQWFGVSD